MKKVAALLCSLLVASAEADTIVDKIHSVESVPGAEVTLVKFSQGRVGYLTSLEKSGEDLSVMEGKEVRAVLDARYNIKALEALEVNEKSLDFDFQDTVRPTYEPTVISSPEEARALFNNLNADYKRKSECSDRAHIWSWEMFKEKGIKSEKVFAFFTATWITKNRLKWWFHVAPLVTVNTGSGTEKLVMDYMFNDRPLPIKSWTDNMVFDSRPCKMTEKFSEYDVNPQTEACYMMIDNMYYRLPADLHAQELRGQYRSNWNLSEVRTSYKWGFKTVKEVSL